MDKTEEEMQIAYDGCLADIEGFHDQPVVIRKYTELEKGDSTPVVGVLVCAILLGCIIAIVLLLTSCVRPGGGLHATETFGAAQFYAQLTAQAGVIP